MSHLPLSEYAYIWIQFTEVNRLSSVSFFLYTLRTCSYLFKCSACSVAVMYLYKEIKFKPQFGFTHFFFRRL